jgi:hypothetical protein
MWSLLAALFDFVARVFREWQDARLREQGSKATEKEAIQNATTIAADVAVPDGARDERLRQRFDRASAPKDQGG